MMAMEPYAVGIPKAWGKTREFHLSTAALRRAMELWTDPMVLASCGDAMAPSASLACTAIAAYYLDNHLLLKSDLSLKRTRDSTESRN